jgi:hypothetical protein
MDANNDIEGNAGKQIRKRKESALYEDIEEMMYGYGDPNWPCACESVELMELLCYEYIQALCTAAIETSKLTGKLDKECFIFQIRKDKRKYDRICKLLKANDELKKVQRIKYENSDEEFVPVQNSGVHTTSTQSSANGNDD